MYPFLLHTVIEFKDESFFKSFLAKLRTGMDTSYLVRELTNYLDNLVRSQGYTDSNFKVSIPGLEVENLKRGVLLEHLLTLMVQILKHKGIHLPTGMKDLTLNMTLLIEPQHRNTEEEALENTAMLRTAYFEDYEDPSSYRRRLPSYRSTVSHQDLDFLPLFNENVCLKVLGAEVWAESSFDRVVEADEDLFTNLLAVKVLPPVRRIFRKINRDYRCFLPHMTLFHIFNSRLRLFDNSTLLEYAIFAEKPNIKFAPTYDVFFPESPELDEFFRHVFSCKAVFERGAFCKDVELLWPFQYVPFGVEGVECTNGVGDIAEFMSHFPELLSSHPFFLKFSSIPAGVLIPSVHVDSGLLSTPKWKSNLSFLYYSHLDGFPPKLFYSPAYPVSRLDSIPFIDFTNIFENSEARNIFEQIGRMLEEGKYIKDKMIKVMRGLFAIMRAVNIVDVGKSEPETSNMLAEYFSSVMDVALNPVSRNLPVVCAGVITDYVAGEKGTYFNFKKDLINYLNFLYPDVSNMAVMKTLGLERDPRFTFNLLVDATKSGFKKSIEKVLSNTAEEAEEAKKIAEEIYEKKNATPGMF